MKIFVIHGDDTQKGYARLSKFVETAKKRSWEVVYIDSDSQNSLSEVVTSPTLFGGERFFIAKDLKIFKDEDFEWINKKKDSLIGNLVIYSNTTLPLSSIKKFTKVDKIEEFKLPFLVYKALDAFYPGNTKSFIGLFREVTENEPTELFFSMLAKHVRDLFWSLQKVTPGVPSWRISKLSSQAKKFGEKKLKKIINKLSLIDYKTKTGEADLTRELDLLAVTSLE